MKAYIFRGLPLTADSRTTRYGSIFKNIAYCTWEKKESSAPQGLETYSFPLPKDGGWTVIKYPLYLCYLFFFSLLKISRKDICICMDLDTYVPILAGSFFRGGKVVFDVVDPASQARFKKFPFTRALDFAELFFIKRSYLSIFPSESRISYYKEKLDIPEINIRHIILENIPHLSISETIDDMPTSSKKITIGYFGTLDRSRGLDILIKFSIDNSHEVDLILAGDGPLSPLAQETASINSNIKFFGKYNSQQLEKLYKKIDFSWMYYCPSIELHKYAAPNKFYEHLCFETPVLTNEIIPQADFINKNKTGIIIDKYIKNNKLEESLIDEIKNFTPGNKLNKYWDQNYKNYYENQSEIFRNALNLNLEEI